MSQSKSLADTPVKQNSAATGVFINGTLEEQRVAVLYDLGNMPEVAVDFMLDHIVPNLGIDVGSTVHDLRQKGVLLDAGWSAFVDALPKHSKDNEQKVFLKMENIYRNIITSSKFDHSLSPTLDVGTCPDIAPISDTNIRSRPDGCGQLNSSHPIHTSRCGYPSHDKGEYHWFNIAYVAGYKKKNTRKDLNDNVLKILWSLHHMMNVDRRRRFAFGVTIENTDTRIWFCCRQTVFVTRRFDFMKEPAKLIRLISSLTYADAAKLGYDPTMKLLWKNDRWNYRITMEGKDSHGNIVTKIYETTDIIADMSSNLRGRATRVYEAYDIENPGISVVIKDSWVDINRPKEGDTLSEVLKDASEDDRALFLTVLLHGVVAIDGRQDLTQDLLMNGYLVSTDESHDILPELAEDNLDHEHAENSMDDFDLWHKIAGDMAGLNISYKPAEDMAGLNPGAENTLPNDHIYKASTFELLAVSKPDSQSASLVTSPDVSATQTKRPPLVYSPKAHYRIVFKERGTSLHSLSRLRQVKLPLVMQAMRDTIKALAFLTKKGYVHRDISPGNIIIYDGRAKLNDLEFAKEYGTGTSNNIRTGTYNFMAVEVQNSHYMFHPRSTFSHNPLHDLESLWWVGMWLLFCHYEPSHLLNATVRAHIKVVKGLGQRLFNNGADSVGRSDAFIGSTLFTKETHSTKFPRPVRPLVLTLDVFKAQLINCYQSYEPEEPRDRSFFTSDVHDKCTVFFQNALNFLGNDKTELWSWDYIEKHIAYLKGRRK